MNLHSLLRTGEKGHLKSVALGREIPGSQNRSSLLVMTDIAGRMPVPGSPFVISYMSLFFRHSPKKTYQFGQKFYRCKEDPGISVHLF